MSAAADPDGGLYLLALSLQAVEAMEKKLSFAKREGLGYLTFCPSNLGTTLRASVHIKIPKLAASPEFKEFCDKYNIQARGTLLAGSAAQFRTRTDRHAHMYTHTHTCTHTYTHTHTCTHTHTHARSHGQTHTRMLTHTHRHTR